MFQRITPFFIPLGSIVKNMSFIKTDTGPLRPSEGKIIGIFLRSISFRTLFGCQPNV